MTQPEYRDIEERLREIDAAKAPPGLMKRLQDEIPARPVVKALDGGVAFDRPSPSRPAGHRSLWVLAASLAVALIGGSVAYRLSQTSSDQFVTASVDGSEPATSLGSGSTATMRTASPEAQAGAAEELVDSAAGAGTANELREPARPAPIPEESAYSDRIESDPDLERELAERRSPFTSLQQPGSARQSPAGDTPTKRSPERLRVGHLGSPEGAFIVSTDEMGAPVSPQAAPVEDVVSPAHGVRSSTGGTAEPNDQPYGGTFFKSYGVNPFIDTDDDPLSTFALDVDTGSYTVARSYLVRGHLPPAEAIRVEEMVNFFDYGDAPPPREGRGAGDFALYAEGAPTPFAEGPAYRLVRFAVRGREVGAAERKPATLIFVVDVSGSMDRENRLGLVRQSLGLLLDQLRVDDRVGLVVYGSRGQVLLEPTGDHEAIRSGIEQLYPGGSTNAEEGLVLAYGLAERFFRPDGINRIVLCSDGVANVGRTGPGSILDRIGTAAERGIELTTIGFGMGNYNDILMEQLADRGDGNYAYVDGLDEARRVFVENLTGTLQTIARDAKIQVEFNPAAVSRYRLLGYENRDVADERFRDDSVDAGEVGAGHSVTALYEVKLQDGVGEGAELATLRLRYQPAAGGEVVESSLTLRRRDLAPTWEQGSTALRLASLVAEYAEVLRQSFWAREGDLEAVFTRAQRLSADLEGDVDVAEFVSLVGVASRLERQGPQSP